MKFSNVVKGKRAEERIEVPGLKDEKGDPFAVLAVPLTGLEYESACTFARARAVEKGVATPGMGDPIYDLALMAFVLSVGCLDPDSDEKNRTSSFKDALEVLTHLHPEMIVYLHERHELWQNECSPNVHSFEGGEAGLYAAVSEVAGPTGRATFMRFSPNTRLVFSLSTARILKEHWDSQRLKSTPGSSSTPDESGDEKKLDETSLPNSSDEKDSASPHPTTES